MPLAELVLAPAGAAPPGSAAKRDAKPPRAVQRQDVCSLLVRVLLRVAQGEALTLGTVKAAWRELSFSHVFEVGAARPCWGAGWLAAAAAADEEDDDDVCFPAQPSPTKISPKHRHPAHLPARLCRRTGRAPQWTSMCSCCMLRR